MSFSPQVLQHKQVINQVLSQYGGNPKPVVGDDYETVVGGVMFYIHNFDTIHSFVELERTLKDVIDSDEVTVRMERNPGKTIFTIAVFVRLSSSSSKKQFKKGGKRTVAAGPITFERVALSALTTAAMAVGCYVYLVHVF